MKRFFFFLFVLVGLLLIGDDLTTKSGKVYKDYSVIGVTVSFAGGTTSIPLSDLPDDLQKKYFAGVAAKKTTDRKQANVRRRSVDLKKIVLDLDGEVTCVQVLESGAIATHGAYQNNFYVDDLSVSRLVDGSLIPPNANGMVHDWDTILNQGKSNAMKPGRVLRLYCIGTFSYEAVSGEQVTIPHFTVNYQRAVNYLKENPTAEIIGMQKKQIVRETGTDVYRRLQWQEHNRQQNIRPQQRQYR